MSLRRRGNWVIVAVTVLGVGAVAGVLFSGPVFIEQPRMTWGGFSPPKATITPAPSQTPVGVPSPPPQFMELLQAMVITALVILAVILLVRALMKMGYSTSDRRTGHVPVMNMAQPFGEDDATVEAPVIQRGIARALAALDEERDPSDAVVQAWLGFEDAAVHAGAGRRAHETPTEYAVRIISRFDADRAAAEELVRVYEGVRFGGRRGDAAAVAAARRCLLALQASWNDAAQGARR